MGFRLHRSIRVLPFLRLNFGKRGASLSIGGRGAHVTIGHGKLRETVGLPGTGLSYTHVEGPHKTHGETAGAAQARGIPWFKLLVLGALVVWLVWLVSGCAFTEALSLDRRLEGANKQCQAALDNDRALDPIRGKVRLFLSETADPPSQELAANSSLAAPAEQAAIETWMQLRRECFNSQHAAMLIPKDASPRLAADLSQIFWADTESVRRINGLIVALHDRDITFGEFEQTHYEFLRSAHQLHKKLDHAVLHHDTVEYDATVAEFKLQLLHYDTLITAFEKLPPGSAPRLDL